jgi:excisionase family DNA binding protein
MNQPFQISRRTPFEDLPEFMTVEDCRIYLGVGRATIYELLRRGEMPSVKFGRLIRVPKTAFEPPRPKEPTRSTSARSL